MTLTPVAVEYAVYALAIVLAIGARLAGLSPWVIVPLVLAVIAARVLARRAARRY